MAKGAPHEIEGLIWLLISAVCFAGAGIIEVGAGIIEEMRAPKELEQAALKNGDLLVCSGCKGYIPKGASRCRHCGSPLSAPPVK